MPSLLLRHRRRHALVLSCVVAAGAVGAGCGGSSGPGGNADADPASAAPAAAPLYAAVVVQPDGTLKSDAESVLEKILRTDDPSAKIKKALREHGDAKNKVDFDKDVQPWLGKRAGVFLTTFAGSNPDGALVIAAKDTSKAKDFVASDVKNDGKADSKKSYKNVNYTISGNGAEAVVGDFVVIGSDKGMRSVIDVIKDDGAALNSVADFKRSQADVGASSGLASFYVNANGIVDALGAAGRFPPQALSAVRQALATSAPKALGGKVGIGEDRISIETASMIKAPSTKTDAGDAAGAVAKLPGDALLGLGIGAIGAKGRQAIQQVSQIGALGGIGVDTILNQVKQATGLDVDRDLLSWMGDGALFVRGKSLADIGGALVVQSSNPSRTRTAIGKIAKLIRSMGVGDTKVANADIPGTQRAIEISSARASGIKVYVVSAGDRFIAAVGRPALSAALKPASTLSSDADFKKAQDQLGDGVKPVLFVSIAPILDFAEGLGAGSDPGYAKAKPYLQTFSAIVAGSEHEGDIARGKLAVTLK